MTRDEQRREDLLTTVDTIDDDAAALGEIEDAKRGLDPDDPRMADLSETAVQLADRLKRATSAERQLVNEAQAGAAPARPN